MPGREGGGEAALALNTCRGLRAMDCWLLTTCPFPLTVVGAPTTKRRADEFSEQCSDTQDACHPLPHAFCNVAAHLHLPLNPRHNYLLLTAFSPFVIHSALSLRCPSQGTWLCLWWAPLWIISRWLPLFPLSSVSSSLQTQLTLSPLIRKTREKPPSS